jgi:hypothetical protein
MDVWPHLCTLGKPETPLQWLGRRDLWAVRGWYFGHLKTAPILQQSLQWEGSSDKVYSLQGEIFAAGNNFPFPGV